MTREFINLIIALRKAQKEDDEKHLRSTAATRVRIETRVDAWILNYTMKRDQLDLWKQHHQTDETPGAYNVTHDDEAQDKSNA